MNCRTAGGPAVRPTEDGGAGPWRCREDGVYEGEDQEVRQGRESLNVTQC